MKWPKSEENIEIGGLGKLGGPPEGNLGDPLQMSGCAIAYPTFFLQNLMKKKLLSYLSNEVADYSIL